MQWLTPELVLVCLLICQACSLRWVVVDVQWYTFFGGDGALAKQICDKRKCLVKNWVLGSDVEKHRKAAYTWEKSERSGPGPVQFKTVRSKHLDQTGSHGSGAWTGPWLDWSKGLDRTVETKPLFLVICEIAICAMRCKAMQKCATEWLKSATALSEQVYAVTRNYHITSKQWQL